MAAHCVYYTLVSFFKVSAPTVNIFFMSVHLLHEHFKERMFSHMVPESLFGHKVFHGSQTSRVRQIFSFSYHLWFHVWSQMAFLIVLLLRHHFWQIYYISSYVLCAALPVHCIILCELCIIYRRQFAECHSPYKTQLCCVVHNCSFWQST